MKGKRNTPEESIIAKIDLQTHCGADLKKFMKIIQRKGFVEDLQAQSEAGTIARGIMLKMDALLGQAHFENEQFEKLRDLLGRFAGKFTSMFEKKQIEIGFNEDKPLVVTVIKRFAEDQESTSEQ